MSRPASPGLRTAPEERPLSDVRLARNVRRVGIIVLLAFLACGAAGVFGVRSRTVQASGGGYRLRVTYAEVTRPGLATPWSVEVRRPGGFTGPVVVATSASYFDLFDENGLDPEPSSSTTSDDLLVWEFDPPAGDVLTVSFDGRIEPAVQSGGSGRTAVLEGGRPVAEVRYRTRVFP